MGHRDISIHNTTRSAIRAREIHDTITSYYVLIAEKYMKSDDSIQAKTNSVTMCNNSLVIGRVGWLLITPYNCIQVSAITQTPGIHWISGVAA